VLDDLISQHLISEQIAEKVLTQFDASMMSALQKIRTKANFKGHIKIYRFCSDVWTFILENPTIRTETENIQCDKLKIVATDDTKITTNQEEEKNVPEKES